MAFLRPLHVGERLAVQARVASRGERQGWVLMGISLNVEDDNHGPVMTGRATVTMPAGPEGAA
jgi:acyl dehydratase